MDTYAKREVPFLYYSTMDSPLGKLLLVSDGTYLRGLYMDGQMKAHWQVRDLPVFDEVRAWLREYFAGKNPDAERLPLKAEGTPFQKEVWNLLRVIPYGETRTYGDLAREMARIMGKEKMSAQAVGQAVGSNPISILIPCHRVVGVKGKLTGYAWGIEKKEWLLKHERSLRQEEK